MIDKVTYNTAVQFIGKTVVGLSALALISLLTRGLGESGFGAYSTIFTWVIILKVFADMGLYMTGVRELSGLSADQAEITGNLLTLKLINSAVIIVISIILIVFMPYDQRVKLGILIGLSSMFALTAADAFKSLFQARLKMHFAVIGESAGAVLTLVLSFAVLQSGWGLCAVISAAAAGSLLNLLLYILFSQRLVRIRLRFDRRVLRSLFQKALPLGLSGIMAVVYIRVDMLMLSWMKPLEDVGIYGAAYWIVELSSVVPVLFLGTIFPLFTRAIEASDNSLAKLYDRAFSFISSLALPFLFGGMILAGSIMMLIAGQDFSFYRTIDMPFIGMVDVNAVTTTFRILLAATALMFWGQLNGYLMIAGNMQKKLLKLYFFLVPANIMLNLVMIPRYSYLGAATSTLLTEVLALIYTTVIIAKELGQLPRMKRVMQALVASVSMSVLVWWLDIHLFLSVAVGAGCYFLVLRLVGGTVGMPRQWT
ncbi:MAG TPA: flippase [Desulfobacteraceae bacterium]|nr:flippase [Desulfobacteraceae bacterium]HPJ66348.1 flippase [Desulfobacteraceae bacterium]HPQ27192.1 flippase [Desulfobacteraceae bacterium]